MPPSSRIDIPVGFQGVVRLRLDPVIELKPSTARQNLSDPANAVAGVERRISLTGTSTNLAGEIPCSLEWLVQSDDWDTAPRVIPETRGALAVRGQGGQYVVTLDGKPLSTVDIIKLGLVGRGKLGYRIVPAVKNPLEVPPERSPISFDFRARLAPQGELAVGSLVRLLPDFDPVFDNQRVRLTIFEQIGETERPRHVYEWTVGDRDQEDDIVWRVGCRDALAPAAPPAAPGTPPADVEQRLLPPVFEYIDHLEGEGGKLEHRLRLEFVPPPKPNARKQAEPLCSLTGLQRLDAPMPRLTAFELDLRRGPRLVASGAFAGFHESLDIPLELELHGIRPPDSDPDTEHRPHPLRELILDVCPPELQTSIAGEGGRVGAAIDRLLSAETGALARPHRSGHTFEAVLLDFTSDDGKALAPLWKAVHAAGYRVFAELRISETVTDNKPTPVVFVARYHARTEPDDDGAGFVPIGHGVLGPPLTSLGVGSNLIDVGGHSSELVPPGRAIERVPEDKYEDLKWFVACVVGEARNSSALAQRAVGHSIMNRIGAREWSATRSVKDVVTFKSAYECYGGGKKVPNFVDGENYADRYIKTRGNVEGRDAVLDDLIEATLPVFLGEAGDGHDVTLYFSPSAQRQLGRTAPDWAMSSQLEDITDLLLSGSRDDFKFYRYKPKT